MSLQSSKSSSAGLNQSFMEHLIDEHVNGAVPHLERLWEYYRNEIIESGLHGQTDQKFRVAQSQGLPVRLMGSDEGGVGFNGQPSREVVIENDIAWRVHTLVDFMFGKPISLQSCAQDKERASRIEYFLQKVFELNGGIGFLQNMALLGSVYGYVDVLLRLDAPKSTTGVDADLPTEARLAENADRFILEMIEAPRAIPVLNPNDFRKLDAYILHYRQVLNHLEESSWLSRASSRMFGGTVGGSRRASIERTQVWTDHAVETFEESGGGRSVIGQEINRLGRIPLVHIQNLPQPFFYEGLSEVEPLIGLQDELNTRLSDRANRVTFQSFKMYLGKGIDGFTERPVGPGQMWSTDNLEASIQEFGGDSNNPSEDVHISELREAMDKASAVTPVAAGLLRGKVGNLTSSNALRVTLMGLLAKTEKKRVTYGVGIQKLSEMILHAADVYGVFPNTPDERGVRVDWPSMLPENDSQRLKDAQIKLDIGVSKKQVLMELGYGDCS